MGNALISLKPRFVESILSGKKTVELRRRHMNLSPGTKLWIYSTLPKGCIEAVVTVETVHLEPPEKIWKKFGRKICISRKEFDDYISGRDEVCAISLKLVTKVSPSLDLESLRLHMAGEFHPPQFFKKLERDSPLLKFLDLAYY